MNEEVEKRERKELYDGVIVERSWRFYCKCGYKVEANWSYCPICGHKLWQHKDEDKIES